MNQWTGFILLCFLIASSYTKEQPVRFLTRVQYEEHNIITTRTDDFSSILPNATLVASPNVISNGEDVVVSWSGVENASKNDWVAIFCPADLGSDSDYLDYLYTNTIESSGSVRFTNLLNMRCEYGFRYYYGTKNSEGRYPLVAVSNKVQLAQGITEVTQIHTSLTSTPSQMQITWVTGSNKYNPAVIYGSSEDNLNQTATSSASASQTYRADQMCGSPANTTSQATFRDPGWIHSVLLENLEPNKIYFYQCGNSIEGWSDVQWLRTSPSSSSFTDPETASTDTKFIVYGDMGVDAPPAAFTTADRVANDVYSGYQMILHIGDISYARGYAYIWEIFFNLIQEIASHVPYMVNIGNHEYDHTSGGQNDPSQAPGDGFHPVWGNYGDDSNGECSVPVYYRFFTPTNGHGVYWYSFEFGNVHIIMMSTEHDYTPGSDQYLWISSDLASVNRERTPFILFAGHRPMYDSEAYIGDWEVSLGIRQSLEDLLFQYKVDLAMWGHYHSYQRTCPVYKGECNENGSVHIVVGTAGASLDDANLYVPRPWSEAYISDFGYCRVSSTRNTLTVQFIHNDSGSIGDEIVINAKY